MSPLVCACLSVQHNYKGVYSWANYGISFGGDLTGLRNSFMAQALHQFPELDGWYNHQVTITEIPMDMVKRAYEIGEIEVQLDSAWDEIGDIL